MTALTDTRGLRAAGAMLAVAMSAALLAHPGPAAPPDQSGPVTLKAKKCKSKKKAGASGKRKCKKKKKPGVPAVSEVTIVLSSYTSGVSFDQIRGTISSPAPACMSEANMAHLFEGEPGFGTPLESVFPVNGTLTFTFPTQTSGDRFHARADGALIGKANCGDAVSNVITKP